MKKRLILVLDNYPVEPGEYSFIRTELDYLLEHFEVVMVSLAPWQEQKMEIDGRISLYHCIRKFGLKEKIEAVVKFFFSQCGLREMREIIAGGEQIAGRLYDSLSYFGCADQLRKYVKKNHLLQGDELIYSYWFNANCMAFLMDKKSYPNIKVVSRIHNYDLFNERTCHGRQPFREYMDEVVDKIFFIADTGLQYYRKRWGKDKDIANKYVLAMIGSEDCILHDNMDSITPRNYFHIVSCSYVIPLKRVRLIIEGLAQIKDIEIRWTHFGAGTHYEETKIYADEMLSDSENISYEMPGFVPVKEIMRFYKEHYIDCFLTTSSVEGSPVSIQEAMAYGIPVIGTAVGEIPNMINGNGILLPENPTPEDIRHAVISLYQTSQEERIQMRKRSRKIWEEKYNAKRNAEKFVRMLMEIS